MEEVEVIHSWSAPRSLSTSLMYSFAQRDDIEVLDEPLYAHFLRVTGVTRPYREKVLSSMEADGDKVMKEVIFAPGKKRYRFCKHMAKQRLPGLKDDLMKKGKHFILIRNPLDVLASFEKVVLPTFLEIGLAELVAIYSELCGLGKAPPIIDAAELQKDPEGTLRGLCQDLDIPFQPSMLKWEAGPKAVDGVWAPWWYGSVHKSTCFSSPNKYPKPFPSSLYDLLEQSLPLYNFLRRHVKRSSSLLKSPLPDPTLPVPENAKLLAWVGDEILPRENAKVSVFDSVVQGGDSVWEGLRVYNGKIFKLEEHLDSWTIIASKFKDKTTRQCRRRWYTYLNSDFKKGGWSPEEDILLCEAQKVFGNRWTEIAKVVSGRTDNAVKNRFTTLCKKRAKNQALAKENNTSYINDNNKRAISSDVASPLKKLRAAHIPNLPVSCNVGDKGCCTLGKQHFRPPFAVLAENIRKLNTLLPQNQANPLETLVEGNGKIEGTFLRKDDPKILALLQQADLLSSLAIKVNTENTEQSLDNAWKVLENFLNKSKDSEVIKCTMFEEDSQLDHLKDLVEELRSGSGEIQPSQRQPDLYDSPSSSEYSNGSMMSTNASEQMEQTQPEICTLNDNAGSGLQTIEANSDNKVLARESTNQEEISVPCVEEEIDEDVSALLLAELSSPLQITPLFKSFAATVPSPQFSESERHFLMKTLGIESPAPSKSTNPSSQPPLCRRALIHSL